MLVLLWDASALVKRYAPELGSDVVSTLFEAVPPAQMVVTVLGCAETHAIIVRKKNGGVIKPSTYSAAASLLQNEVIYGPDFGVLPLEFDAILSGIDLITRHNINSADASILMTYLQFAADARVSDTSCLLVATDRRLLRAAQAEGLETINPESVSEVGLADYLARLTAWHP